MSSTLESDLELMAPVMNQHRKLTLEKKIIPPLLPGLEPETFGFLNSENSSM